MEREYIIDRIKCEEIINIPQSAIRDTSMFSTTGQVGALPLCRLLQALFSNTYTAARAEQETDSDAWLAAGNGRSKWAAGGDQLVALNERAREQCQQCRSAEEAGIFGVVKESSYVVNSTTAISYSPFLLSVCSFVLNPGLKFRLSRKNIDGSVQI